MNAERAEILISRLIDGEAGAAEWHEFQALAADAPALWRELAESQRQNVLLGAAVAEATKAAAAIDLPDLADEPTRRVAVEVSRGPWHQRVSAYVGWGVAAALAITLWTGARPNANLSSPPGGADNMLAGKSPSPDFNYASLAPNDILQGYLDRGKEEGLVIGELPDKVLLESRPHPSGDGFEVLFIRPILERATVPQLFEFAAQDDAGRPVLGRYTGGERRPL